ncbi:EamA family transporter [Erwinia sp. SLM-02]|uniref:EamA family transporter n=1 Tax=Erwinia sp. SLM-02 TaxID=3020057 RepID=UPI0028D64292|nr:EamA family transporter [uncultured Erwinia sp.]
MSNLTLLLWLLNVIVDSLGQLSFKAAASGSAHYQGMQQWRYMLLRPWIWLGMACYILEFVLWLAFLTLVPLSVGMLLGCTSIVTIMLAGRIWFKESLTRWRLTGILLITLGVGIIGIN